RSIYPCALTLWDRFELADRGVLSIGAMAVIGGEHECRRARVLGGPCLFLTVFAFFAAVPEPRVERMRLHPPPNISIIALLAMIRVGEGWEGMEQFGL